MRRMNKVDPQYLLSPLASETAKRRAWKAGCSIFYERAKPLWSPFASLLASVWGALWECFLLTDQNLLCGQFLLIILRWFPCSLLGDSNNCLAAGSDKQELWRRALSGSHCRLPGRIYWKRNRCNSLVTSCHTLSPFVYDRIEEIKNVKRTLVARILGSAVHI